MRRFRRNIRLRKTTEATPSPGFVERQVLAYAIRLIDTNHLEVMTENVLNFVCALGVKDRFEDLLHKSMKARQKGNIVARGNNSDLYPDIDDFRSLSKSVGKAGIIKIFRNEILSALKEKFDICEINTATDRRLRNLEKIFKLGKVGSALVGFSYCLANFNPLKHLYSHLDLEMKVVFLNNIGEILGFHRNAVRKALIGNLTKCKILDPDGFQIPDWVDNYLSNLKTSLNDNFFIKFKDTALDLDAHLIEKPELEILRDLVSHNRPANLLFYGEPGTGKSELAKSLSRHFKKELLIINNRKNVDSDDLMKALIATANIADPKTSLILMDEADDLLNSSMSYFFSGEKGQKSWLNDFMDQNKHKIIWVTNRSNYIESSTMRRFAFSLKFKPFNLKKKLQVFNYCLKKYGYKDLFLEDDLIKICRRYTINAGGISDALKNLRVGRRPDKNRILEKIETILKNHQTAITGIEYKANPLKDMGKYSLKALNTSENLDLILTTLREFPGSGDNNLKGRPANINILLYGPPGAGKTEFVKYLGNTLQKEIVVKRASDLISCMWGGTEKNIANAFDEAEGNESILFLDEADSFLRPRESARYSWESMEVNELLTQMENFRGILICSTNFLKGLDQAALRRFKFKIEFKPLTAEGVLEMYRTVLTPLIGKVELAASETRELSRLAGLTPGDFHVVAEKYHFANSSSLSHRLMIDSLKEELKLKPKNRSIGFAA